MRVALIIHALTISLQTPSKPVLLQREGCARIILHLVGMSFLHSNLLFPFPTFYSTSNSQPPRVLLLSTVFNLSFTISLYQKFTLQLYLNQFLKKPPSTKSKNSSQNLSLQISTFFLSKKVVFLVLICYQNLDFWLKNWFKVEGLEKKKWFRFELSWCSYCKGVALRKESLLNEMRREGWEEHPSLWNSFLPLCTRCTLLNYVEALTNLPHSDVGMLINENPLLFRKGKVDAHWLSDSFQCTSWSSN